MLARTPAATMDIPNVRLKSFWTYRVLCPQPTQFRTMPSSRIDRSTLTGTFFWQYGQSTSSVLVGAKRISPSHALQPKLIIPAMKPLILVLLFALSAEAQSVADAARQERQRRNELKSVRVLTNEDTKS